MTEAERRELDAAALGEMCGALAKTQDPGLIQDFFECLLTPPERGRVAERWLLVREIAKGATQREVAKLFGMSLCKITRGARELKKKDSAFKKMFSLVEPLP